MSYTWGHTVFSRHLLSLQPGRTEIPNSLFNVIESVTFVAACIIHFFFHALNLFPTSNKPPYGFIMFAFSLALTYSRMETLGNMASTLIKNSWYATSWRQLALPADWRRKKAFHPHRNLPEASVKGITYTTENICIFFSHHSPPQEYFWSCRNVSSFEYALGLAVSFGSCMICVSPRATIHSEILSVFRETSLHVCFESRLLS